MDGLSTGALTPPVQGVGLLLGSTGEFSSWLLAATVTLLLLTTALQVGVFLYVGLVSMMAELAATSITGVLINTVGMVSHRLFDGV